MKKEFYVVDSGDVTKIESLIEENIIFADEKCDWSESILVYCESEERAIDLAVAYDQGLIDGDNFTLNCCYTVKCIQDQS